MKRDCSALVLAFWITACSSTAPDTPAVLVAHDPLDLAPSPQRVEPSNVLVELTAREVVAELANGVKASVWTFNDRVPGPLIRVVQGDTVVLRLTNDSSSVEPHSIDLHAAAVPGGGGVLTEVGPGETAELSFRAEHQGAFLYHCAAEGMPWEHVAYGMYGMIVVEPPGGLEPVATEAYVAQSEWYLRDSGGEGHEMEGEEEEEEEEGEGALPADVLVLDESAAFASQPTLYTFNGHRDALTAPGMFGDRIRTPAGANMRIFFANAGPNLPSSFHVVGGIFDRVFTGNFQQSLNDEETVLVAPGSAAVFELTLPVAGDYEMVDHALFRAARGARGMIHSISPEP
ncbi:MAG: multicopper oxidase domain-containing protein [Myxococcota bacterium]